ncbi:MAG: hypothetical protein R3E08_12350 [Thiotrichaceae bacterium]
MSIRQNMVFQEGDIMVTGVGTLGICYVVKQNDKFYFKDGNIIWLKKKLAQIRFVEYAFKSDFCVIKLIIRLVRQLELTIIVPKILKIPLPLHEQHALCWPRCCAWVALLPLCQH